MAIWIAHRGYTQGGVENTFQAFDQAVQHGFSYIETDLRLSHDGAIVLSHDPTLERLGGPARALAAMSKAEIANLTLVGSTRPMFWEELLERFRGVSWTFDIKIETGFSVIEKLLAWAGEHSENQRFLERSRFLFWDPKQEKTLCEALPNVRCYARIEECRLAGLTTLVGLGLLSHIRPQRTYSLPPSLGFLNLYTPRMMRAYRRRGARLLAYLPETREAVEAALAIGVDEILLNDDVTPDLRIRS